MNRILRTLPLVALTTIFTGCEDRKVSVTESAPGQSGQANPEGLPPPVVMPAGTLGAPPNQSALSADDAASFESWFLKYGLDTKDKAMFDADADADGFSNREEFLANTNPLDANSMPGMVEGLAMKELKDVRVPMILRQVKDGKARVERTDLNTIEELKEGSTPTGTAYRVKSVKQEVKADKHGVFSDVSQVVMENAQTNDTVVLVRDLPARSNETHAVLVATDGTEKKVHVDEVVTLPGQGTKQFRVLELRPDQVVVEEVGARRPLTIPKR